MKRIGTAVMLVGLLALPLPAAAQGRLVAAAARGTGARTAAEFIAAHGQGSLATAQLRAMQSGLSISRVETRTIAQADFGSRVSPVTVTPQAPKATSAAVQAPPPASRPTNVRGEVRDRAYWTERRPPRNDFNLASGSTERVQRAMSREELARLEGTNGTTVLSRRQTDGAFRAGDHHVTPQANRRATRVHQRLSLPGQRRDVVATLDVPTTAFSPATRVEPRYNMPGGGLERVAPGRMDVPVKIVRVDKLK